MNINSIDSTAIHNLDDLISDKFFKPTFNCILQVQEKGGAIPELAGGTVEPWLNVECAMAIDCGGFHEEAMKAYEWLAVNQMSDGSWYAYYQNEAPKEMHKVSHAISYIAVGIWHHYLVTGDIKFVKKMWPCVRSAIDYIIDMRGPNGEIFWARDKAGDLLRSYQITSCSSNYLGIKCALKIATLLKEKRLDWELINDRLQAVILNTPLPYEGLAEVKNCDAFAMDWYYPILCSVLSGNEAVKRIDDNWDYFVVHGMGSVCNMKKTWVTPAETSELVMSLAAHGQLKQAAMVYKWIHQFRDDDGAYWYGLALPENEIWPLEKPTWTSAAVILAGDMLKPGSPTNLLLNHN